MRDSVLLYRWNPRSPAIELDRQGRSCRREDERIRGSTRFTRRPVRDRPTLAGPEDSPRPRPRPRSRRKERKKPHEKGRQDRETNGEKERERGKGIKKRNRKRSEEDDLKLEEEKVDGRRIALRRSLLSLSLRLSVSLPLHPYSPVSRYDFVPLYLFLVRRFLRSSFRLLYFCPPSLSHFLQLASSIRFSPLPRSPFLMPSDNSLRTFASRAARVCGVAYKVACDEASRHSDRA